MKTTFAEFINMNTNCNKFADNADAKQIFDFLSSDDSIIRMIESADMGKPALTPVIREVERMIENKPDATISFNDNFTKQTVGLMARAILMPFGYAVTVQKSFPKSIGEGKFTSASCYCYDPSKNPPTMCVVKKIEEIEAE